MPEKEKDIHYLTELRKELHAWPETSGEEIKTAAKISELMNHAGADEVITGVGGTGVLALFKSENGRSEKNLLFRAELDAIPVDENTGLPYRSQNPGKMHACGHDGHMAILVGFARHLQENRPENINTWLLFQPAEETGEGAAQVMQDDRFKKLNFNHAFALHNLPGFSKNSVCIKRGSFASASVGMDIHFEGKFSHAANPEHGINPAGAVGAFLVDVQNQQKAFKEKSSQNKITVTFIKMGEPAFGISPGKARLGITVRAATDEEMESGVNRIKKVIEKTRENFAGSISYHKAEPFAATVNSDEGVEVVKKAAEMNHLKIREPGTPFSWSEDFGEFRKKCPVTLFGLGSGEGSPSLHSERYDFNDEMIPAGISMFVEILKQESQSV